MTSQTARAATPQSPVLLRETLGSIAVLTLNRPEGRNSLSEGLIAELHAALRDIHDDASVRAVVIAANGPAFSAGHDMKELTARRTDADRGRAYFAQIMNACSAMMQAIVHLPKPVVAAVQGVATAAGCQLVASCDLAVASEAATFATPGRRYRTVLLDADGGAVAQRSAQAGDGNAAHRRAGFGSERRAISASSTASSPPAPNGMRRSRWRKKVALKSAYTIKLGKAAFYRQAEMSLADAYRYAAEVMTENMMARDAEEGIGAFIEKREPKWQDK